MRMMLINPHAKRKATLIVLKSNFHLRPRTLNTVSGRSTYRFVSIVYFSWQIMIKYQQRCFARQEAND
jgi:hypothetical protein